MEIAEQIKRFTEFFEETYKAALLEDVRKGNRFFVADFSELSKFDPELAEMVLDQPEDVIRAGELAIEQMTDTTNFRLRFSLLPLSQDIKIRNIRSENLGKLIVIDGIVRQASDVRPQVSIARFECPSCGRTISVHQVETKFKEPSRCSCGYKGRFKMIDKELVDTQRLVIEENPELLDGGDQPKRISVFHKADLVEPRMERKTTPGNRVKISGIIKEIPIILNTGVQSTRYDIIIDANFIESVSQSYEDLEIDEETLQKIKEIAQDKGVFERLVKSIAPLVWGHEDIKEALVLQLMGGVRKERRDGTITRGDIHILLVGDPGAAKSTLLTFMKTVSPKARYVAGKSASGVGLTAAVVKDEFLKGYALEAGAIVLASGGFCLIDEMDKMSEDDTSTLHEAMAQQTISISKANIQATLKAQTTILAAANPKLGRFDPYTPIASQINLPPTLINRFDLIFPVRDLPDKDKDEKIAMHVLKLQQSDTLSIPEIEADLMKRYVAYVRRKIQPILTDTAIQEISNYYVALRNTDSSGEGLQPIPISARQLESLVRLAEGSARVRMSQKVTRNDARRAIDALQRCLMAVGYDYETGKIDIDRITTGITSSQRSKILIVREIINELEGRMGKEIPFEDLVLAAREKGLEDHIVEEIVEQLKRQGDIYEPKRGTIAKL
ncbi:TPA: minichromosome maintenance protein MCM [Candidatus Woesearchaeota archaeon]|nr:minichromosome maintenance protein MCM [Candidatus Woesearchaeota archaeon]